MINLIANSVVAFILLALLIFINPKLALITGFTLSLAYALIYKIVTGKIRVTEDMI